MTINIEDCGTAAEFLAARAMQLRNCKESLDNGRWTRKHYDDVTNAAKDAISQVCGAVLPSGSGFDNGTRFETELSTGSKLVFNTGYHHMTETGFYDGWTEHGITVRPCFVYGFDMRISGRNRNDVKDTIENVMCEALRTRIVSLFDSRRVGFCRPVTYVAEEHKDVAYERLAASLAADTIESEPCGCCEYHHRRGFAGDCREDSEGFILAGYTDSAGKYTPMDSDDPAPTHFDESDAGYYSREALAEHKERQESDE